MTRFSSEWLRLREPLDAASRAPGIARTLRRARPDRPLHIADLASGTGANLRCLGAVLGGHQEWQLIDYDRDLLNAIPVCMREWAAACGARVEQSGGELVVTGQNFECFTRRLQHNLATGLPDVTLPARGLVTASALLDLVSDTWLAALAQRCFRARAAVLFTLIYDGRMEFQPDEPEDTRIRQLVNRHQTTDKGFGPALGSAATERARQRFSGLGYQVEWALSDWRIKPDEQVVQNALLDGWLAAAVEIAPEETSILQHWHQRRRSHVVAGHSEIRVGHVDLLGLMPD